MEKLGIFILKLSLPWRLAARRFRGITKNTTVSIGGLADTCLQGLTKFTEEY
jgi:hypothetical protein